MSSRQTLYRNYSSNANEIVTSTIE